MKVLGMQNEAITVFTRNDLLDALKKRYGKITITGEMAAKVLADLNKNREVQAGLSGAAVTGGLIATLLGGGIVGVPVLLAGMVGGGVSTTNKFRKYRAILNSNESEIVVVRHGSPFDISSNSNQKK